MRPGARPAPVTVTRKLPGDCECPATENSAEPCVAGYGRLASVSTLLTSVGVRRHLLKRRGGLFVG